MKKIVLFFAVLLGGIFLPKAQAQLLTEPQINISAVTDSFPANGIGIVMIQICNLGSDTIPAGKLRPQISVPVASVHIISATNTDGSALDGFKIQSQTKGDIRLLYEKPLPGDGCVSFYVNASTEAAKPGSLSMFGATLGFQGPQPMGNKPANDNGVATIRVGN